MKNVIRRGVWNSNSSSVHALTIDKSGMRPSNLPTDSEGYIVGHFGYFGTEECVYSNQEDKLSYLLTQLYYLNHYSDDFSDFYPFLCIEEAICEYTGAKGIKIEGNFNDKCGIDHQSIPEYFELNMGIDYCSNESIQNFIFNSYISFSTGSD